MRVTLGRVSAEGAVRTDRSVRRGTSPRAPCVSGFKPRHPPIKKGDMNGNISDNHNGDIRFNIDLHCVLLDEPHVVP